MMIPDTLKQSSKNETVQGAPVEPRTGGRNSPGSQPVAIIFNDKEQPDEEETYGSKDVRSTAKNDSMLFSSVLGKADGPSASTAQGKCIMSLCGPSGKQSLLLQGPNEGVNSKPKIRSDKNASRASGKRLLSSEMTSPSLFGSVRESKPKATASCCDLCHLFEPEKCWRKCLVEYLDSKSQFVLCLEQEEEKEEELDFAVDERGDHANNSKNSVLATTESSALRKK